MGPSPGPGGAVSGHSRDMSSFGTRVPLWLRYLCYTAKRSSSERGGAALVRSGSPPGLARAPCSRVRSWRIGWVRISSVDVDLDGVADDGHLDLAAPVGVADPVAGPGEADVAGRVDLAGHRCRRRRRRWWRQVAALAIAAALGARVAGGRGWRRARRGGEICTSPSSQTTSTVLAGQPPPALYVDGREADRAVSGDPPGRPLLEPALSRSGRCFSLASSGPGRGAASWNRSNGGTRPIDLVRPLVVVVCTHASSCAWASSIDRTPCR